jgi:hypothetical protein
MNQKQQFKEGGRKPKLQVPEHTDPMIHRQLLEPGAMQEWAANLPLANIQRTGQVVFETLTELNRQDIPHAKRMELAEFFRCPISHVRKNLEKQYLLDSPVPLSIKNRNIATLLQELYAELAIAYKITIEDTLGSKSEIKPTRLSIAIHRAMRHLSDVLVLSTLAYNQHPENTWREIHCLYSLASDRQLQETPIIDTCSSHDRNSSIDSLYRQVLLYGLSSAHCLRQRDTQALFHRLPEWASLARLSKPNLNGSNQGDFVARFNSDQPASHISLQKKKLSNRCRMLDTQPVVKYLRKFAAEVSPSNRLGIYNPENDSLSPVLLQHLIRVWDAPTKRGHMRTGMQFELQLAVGLPAIHTLLEEGARPDPIPASPAPESEHLNDHWLETQISAGSSGADIYPFNLLQEMADSKTATPDPAPQQADAGQIINTTLNGNSTASWAKNGSSQTDQIYSCRTINESASGYCINWGGPKAPKMRVGELIGIQAGRNSGQFGIGVTRWVSHTSEEKVQLGMEIIASNAMAIRLFRQEDGKEESQRCLLLSANTAEDASPSVIIPTLIFQAGDILQMDDGDEEQAIQLTDLMEATAAFARYQITFSPVEAEKPKEAVERKVPASEEKPTATKKRPVIDFTRLWSML